MTSTDAAITFEFKITASLELRRGNMAKNDLGELSREFHDKDSK